MPAPTTSFRVPTDAHFHDALWFLSDSGQVLKTHSPLPRRQATPVTLSCFFLPLPPPSSATNSRQDWFCCLKSRVGVRR